ncbi:MAG: 4Fe-4S binding protein [Alphaproteobacteria bacterium]|nr:4Fe-4S binding protein [Alphaproteobacteria bacterium]
MTADRTRDFPDVPPRGGTVARRIEAVVIGIRPFLPYVHAGMVAFFVVLIVGPLILPPSPLAQNLAHAGNWLIWGLWFPLVFLSVVVAGRTWCGVFCPMGAASAWVNRIGLQRPVPGWLRWEGAPIVSFLVITILGQTVGVREYPGAVLEVFGGTFVAALIIGFLYGRGREKRAWCRHACPIGLLLGVFSRLGIVDLVPKRPVAGGDAYSERGLCPTMIDLKRKTESRHCVMCMHCVQPQSAGGLGLRLRAPGAEVANIAHHHPVASEVWFLYLATGVSLGGFLWLALPQYQWLRQTLGAWAIDRGWTWIGTSGPAWLMAVHPEAREVFVWLDFFMIIGWMVGVMLALTAALLALNALTSWIAGRFGATGRFQDRLVIIGYQVAPAAMVSLLLGLGVELFTLFPPGTASVLKLASLAFAVGWGAWLGWRILGSLRLDGLRRAIVLLPGLVASLLIAAAWWPAIAGG